MELTTRQTRLLENLQAVQARIAEAAQTAGRAVADVQLVAVTKYVDADIARDLVVAGCKVLGESRPQQLWDKAKSLDDLDVRWHLIGHLQRNKVDRTLPLCELIHSVDSERLLTAINAAASEQRLANVLLEVNTSGESEKHGLTAEELPRLLDQTQQWPRVRIRGLMTMAARDATGNAARKSFAALRELRDQVTNNAPANLDLAELSMGMSGDFAEAILEGATIVRVGSALFEGVD